MQCDHRRRIGRWLPGLAVSAVLVSLAAPSVSRAQPKDTAPSSYDQIAPVLQGKETFQAMAARDKADKEAVMARQKKLLDERYDLTPRDRKSVV